MDSLGDRMKGYENVFRFYLPRRLPLILRIDGRAFHTFTRGFKRPFDPLFQGSMRETALALCKEIGGAKLAYVQSDEISILLTNDDALETQPWFDNNLQKLVSISASIATLNFRRIFEEELRGLMKEGNDEDVQNLDAYLDAERIGAQFDARAFIVPPSDVCNYFIWRQQDATRNSIEMAARSLYSHKELDHKNQAMMQDMMMQKGINWNDYPTIYKRGACCKRKTVTAHEAIPGEIRNWEIDLNIPIFTQDRDYIESTMAHTED